MSEVNVPEELINEVVKTVRAEMEKKHGRDVSQLAGAIVYAKHVSGFFSYMGVPEEGIERVIKLSEGFIVCHNGAMQEAAYTCAIELEKTMEERIKALKESHEKTSATIIQMKKGS